MTSNASKIIGQLEAYKKKIEAKTEKVVSDVTKEGERIANMRLSSADYTSKIESTIESSSSGKSGSVSMVGFDAGFIEFGTGTHYPDTHPLASEMGAIRGSYGKGYGLKPPWTFIGDSVGTTGEVIGTARSGVVIETYGNPANRVVYDTGKDLERSAVAIAKEVFNDD